MFSKVCNSETFQIGLPDVTVVTQGITGFRPTNVGPCSIQMWPGRAEPWPLLSLSLSAI